MPAGNRNEISQRQQNIPQQSGQINTGALAGNGTGVPADFSALYRDVAERAAKQQQKEQEDRENKRQDATILDKAAKRVLDIGQSAIDLGQENFQKQLEKGGLESNPIGTLAGLALTLPGSIIGSPIRGLGQMYEVATGRDVQSMEDGTIKAEGLNPSQKAWEALDATINMGGGVVGGSGRVLGAVGKGIAKTDTAAGKFMDKLMPNEGKGLFSKELESAGANKAVQYGVQLAADSAEEGVEEFVQTFAEHGRAGDKFDGDTVNEAIESAGWGAIGGAMMSGSGLAANSAMGAINRAAGDNSQNVPDISGFESLDPITGEVSTLSAIPTAMRQYDTMRKEASKSDGAFGLTMAKNPFDIGLDETWWGIDGVRAQWRAAGKEGRKDLMDMFKLDEATLEKALNEGDLDTLNQNLGGHFEYNRRDIKREPGTSGTTIHGVYVTKITDGARAQLHPWTSQLGNGDIDGDVKTLMHLPGHHTLLPSQLFLNPDGTSTDFNFDYLPELDSEEARRFLTNEIWRRVGNKLEFNGVPQDKIGQIIRRIVGSASRAQAGGSNVRAEFSKHMNDLASLAREISNGDEAFVSNTISSVAAAMYAAIEDQAVYESIIKKYAEVVERAVNESLMSTVEPLDPSKLRTSSGSIGNAQTMAGIAYDYDMVVSLLMGMVSGSLLRSGQSIKYNIASKVQMMTSLDAVLNDAGTDFIERSIAAMMKLTNLGEHINENITSLFNALVITRFMSEIGLDESRRLGNQYGAITTEEMLKTYIEVRNMMAKEFNKATTKHLKKGIDKIIGSVEKQPLSYEHDKKKAAGHLMRTISGYTFDDFFNIPEGSEWSGRFIGDGIREMAFGDIAPSILNIVGKDAAGLINLMIDESREEYDNIDNKIMDDLRKLPRFTPDEIGLAKHYGTETMLLEIMAHIMDPMVCIEEGLYEVYHAAATEYAALIFNGTAEDRANVILTASMRSAYRHVVEAYDKYVKTGDKGFLQIAKDRASILRGDSALSKSIYAELVENETIEQIRFLSDLSKPISEKRFYYEKAAEKAGIRKEPLLASVLSITQPDPSVLNSRIRENRTIMSQVSQEAYRDTVTEADNFIESITELTTSEDQKTIIRDLKDYCTSSIYETNDEFFVSVVADSTGIHLHDNEKGTTIDSAVMYYQQLEMMIFGGPTSVSAQMQDRTTGSMSVKDLLVNKKAWIDLLFNGGAIYPYSNNGANTEPITLATILGHEPTGDMLDNGQRGMSVNDLRELLTKCPQMIRILEPHKMTPSIHENEDGGTGQVATERSVGNMTKRFQAFREGVAKGRQNVKKQQEKARIEVELMNDKRFMVFFASALNINEDGTVDRLEILEKKDELIEDIYQILGHYRPGDEQRIEDAVLDLLTKKLGTAVVGNAASFKHSYSELARNIVDGGVSLVMSPHFIANRICRDVVQTLKDRMNAGYDLSSLVSRGDYVSNAVKAMADNIVEFQNDFMNLDENVDLINGAAFAMLGKTRMRRVIADQMKTTLGFDQIMSERDRNRIDSYINETVDKLFDVMMNKKWAKKFAIEEDINIDGLDDAHAEARLQLAAEKFRKIINNPQHGASPEFQKNMLENLDDAMSKSGKDRTDALEQVRIGIDNLILSRGINNVTSFTGAEVNPFFFEDAFTLASAFRGMIMDLRENPEINVTQADLIKEDRKIRIPNLNISDPKNAFVALMSGRHVSEGQIGVDVGINGFVLKEAYGLALVPHFMSCNIGPSEAKQLNGFNFMKHIGETAIIEYGTHRYTTVLSDSFKAKEFLDKDPDAKIYVYDHTECTCPFCKNHYGGTPNKFSKGYLRTTASYFDLLSWAQEQKNLKLKKALSMIGHIVQQNKFDQLVREDVSVVGLDDKALRDAARGCSNKMKKELTSRYIQVLKSYGALDENGKSKDLDPSVPETMAAMNASVLLLTGTNGEQCYASLYEMHDDAILAEIRERLGGSIESVRSHPVSFEQINSKIEGEVISGLSSKDKYSKKDTDDLAWKAVSEWRNYGTKSESIDYMLSMLPLYQIAGPTNIIPAGHRTAEQILRDNVYHDGTSRGEFQYRGASAKLDENFLEQQKKFQHTDNPKYLITEMTVDDSYQKPVGRNSRGESNIDLFNSAKDGFNTKERFYGNYPSAALFADPTLKRSDIERMLRNGYKGYQYILVPADIVVNMNIPYMKNHVIWGDEFAEIDLFAIHEEQASDSGLTYGEGYFDPEQVCLFVYDKINFHRLGDGPFWINESVARHIKQKNADDVRVDTKAFPAGSYKFDIVPRDQIRRVCKDILDSNTQSRAYYPEKVGGMDKNNVRADAERWFQQIADGDISLDIFDERGFIKSGVGLNTPFAIVSRVYPDGNTYYMPAYYSNGNMPKMLGNISGFDFDERTMEFRFHQITEQDWDGSSSVKVTEDLEASKGHAGTELVVDHDLPEADPSMGVDNVAVANQNTREGRILGTSEKLLKETIFLLAKSKGVVSNFAVVMTSGGQIEINPNLNYDPTGTDRKALTAEEVDILMANYNDKELLTAIANGYKNVFKDENANKVMRRLASECLNGNGITMSNLICLHNLNMSFTDFVNGGQDKAAMTVNRVVPRQIFGVFKRFSFVDMKCLYSKLNNRICPDPFSKEEPGFTYMNDVGDIYTVENGVAAYRPARLSYISFMGDSTAYGQVQVNSSLSMQQSVGYGLRNGVSPSDVHAIVDAIRVKNADLSGYSEIRNNEVNMVSRAIVQDYDPSQNLVDMDYLIGYGKSRYMEQLQRQAETFNKTRIKFTEGGEELSNPMDSDRIDYAFRLFKNVTGASEDHVTFDMFLNMVVKPYHGWSYSDGDGDMTISSSEIQAYAQEFASLMESDNQYVLEGKRRGTGDSARISFGMIPKDIARAAYDIMPKLRDKFPGGLNEWFASMEKQQENTKKEIGAIITTGKGEAAGRLIKKRDALWMLSSFIESTWKVGSNVPAMYSNVVEQDYDDSIRMVQTGMFGTDAEASMQLARQRAIDARKQAIEMQERVNKRGRYQVELDDNGTVISFEKGNLKSPHQKAMDGAVKLMQTMGVFDPGVAAGSLEEGIFRGAVQDIATMLPGPWSRSKRTLDDKFVNELAGNTELQQFMKLLHMTNLSNDLDAFLIGLSEDGATIASVADKMYGNQKWWAKARDAIFRVSSADTVYMKGQLRRMIKFFDTYITQGNYPELMRVIPGTDKTQFQMSIESNPIEFFTSMLATTSPARMEVLRAVNSSNTFSMAQNNAVSIIVDNFTSRSSVANFLVATTISPFVRYNTNIIGRTLNWFMPMSSLNWVVVNQMSNFDTMKAMGIEQAQVYDNLKSALIVDGAHMAFTALGAIILALGLIDYPDDEDKKGNYGEYMFAGMRINEDYVLSDLTGPLFPYACFMKNVMDGNPRLDVLVNGMADIASKNPMMKIGDIINTILSPDQMFEDWEDEAQNYEDTIHGKPTFPEIAKGTMMSTLMSLAGKITTPSLLRNIGKAYDYERSYKRVWAPDSGDVNIGAGKVTDTVRVDYEEAMIRKVTRDNPVIGVFWNFMTNADTSYTGLTKLGAKRDMTPVIYSDPYQRLIMEEYSIYYKDENGEYVEKSDAEKQSIALNIIATLQSYENMEELYDTGFMIDSRTRTYVGDIVWQTVAGLQTEYYNWANSENADEYYLGGGDYLSGRAIKNDAYNQMRQTVDYWKSFYYDKLNSAPMKRGLQKYLRDNVQYWQDDNGNWYASGFKRGMDLFNYLTGLKMAPGTIDSWVGTKENPEGTMGYDGDWDTPSKVTGLSMFERAMHDIPQDIEETIPFDNLANNHPDLAEAMEAAKNGTKSSGSSGGGGRRSGGGGGGGGGGGSTNIYSRPGNMNVPSARTISTGRPYDSKLDYLRPGFETKGSREASRRSDF